MGSADKSSRDDNGLMDTIFIFTGGKATKIKGEELISATSKLFGGKAYLDPDNDVVVKAVPPIDRKTLEQKAIKLREQFPWIIDVDALPF
jgi:hypothetical protein